MIEGKGHKCSSKSNVYCIIKQCVMEFLLCRGKGKGKGKGKGMGNVIAIIQKSMDYEETLIKVGAKAKFGLRDFEKDMKNVFLDHC